MSPMFRSKSNMFLIFRERQSFARIPTPVVNARRIHCDGLAEIESPRASGRNRVYLDP